MGMVNEFLVGPHYILADQPPFLSKYAGEKLSSFDAVLDKNARNLSLIALLGTIYLSDK